MQTEDAVRARRDEMWNTCLELETFAGITGDEESQIKANMFALMTGTLDWVLDEIDD